jgi:hypothetical protein
MQYGWQEWYNASRGVAICRKCIGRNAEKQVSNVADDGENPYDPASAVDTTAVPRRKRRVLFWASTIGLVFTIGLASGVLVMVDRAREAAARSSCNLGGITLAFHNYEDVHGRLPPAIVRDADGKPLYSWRVLILPYIEQRDLYEEFRLDEPWNSEHNLRLLDRMPSSYAAPWTRRVNVPPYHTVCRVLSGPGTPFDERVSVRIPEDFTDGLSSTLLFVEAGKPVPWTKPEEIIYDPARPVRLQGLFRNGFRACTADGQYQFIDHNTDQTVLHALITRNGGENLPTDW